MYKKKYFKRLIKLLSSSFHESHRLIITDNYLELKIHFNDGKEENWIYRDGDFVSLSSIYFSVEREFNQRK